MSRLFLLALLSFAVPCVFAKVHHIRRSSKHNSPTLISLKDSVPVITDDVVGFSEEPGRRFKRSVDNERLIVNMTILPDEGHNEAIVHWSGQNSLVRSL